MRRLAKTDSAGGRHPLWPVWAICGFLVLAFVAAITVMIFKERPKVSDIAVIDVPETSEIRFHAADFPAGELRLFRIPGTGIILALKRLPDRHVHAALSSCTVCSREGHNGYARKNKMVCGICNQPMRFESDAIAAREAKNQCPLPEIPVSEERETIVIATKDVLRVADRALMK
jgi:hypothetical protein